MAITPTIQPLSLFYQVASFVITKKLESPSCREKVSLKNQWDALKRFDENCDLKPTMQKIEESVISTFQRSNLLGLDLSQSEKDAFLTNKVHRLFTRLAARFQAPDATIPVDYASYARLHQALEDKVLEKYRASGLMGFFVENLPDKTLASVKESVRNEKLNFPI
jgi:hypothetical protein